MTFGFQVQTNALHRERGGQAEPLQLELCVVPRARDRGLLGLLDGVVVVHVGERRHRVALEERGGPLQPAALEEVDDTGLAAVGGAGEVVVDEGVAVVAVGVGVAVERPAGRGVDHVLVGALRGLDVGRPARAQAGGSQEPHPGGLVVVGPRGRGRGAATAARDRRVGQTGIHVVRGEGSGLRRADPARGRRPGGKPGQTGDGAALDGQHPAVTVDPDEQAVAEDGAAGGLLAPREVVQPGRVDVVATEPQGLEVTPVEAEGGHVGPHVAEGDRASRRLGAAGEVAVELPDVAHGVGERVHGDDGLGAEAPVVGLVGLGPGA